MLTRLYSNWEQTKGILLLAFASIMKLLPSLDPFSALCMTTSPCQTDSCDGSTGFRRIWKRISPRSRYEMGQSPRQLRPHGSRRSFRLGIGANSGLSATLCGYANTCKSRGKFSTFSKLISLHTFRICQIAQLRVIHSSEPSKKKSRI